MQKVFSSVFAFLLTADKFFVSCFWHNQCPFLSKVLLNISGNWWCQLHLYRFYVALVEIMLLSGIQTRAQNKRTLCRWHRIIEKSDSPRIIYSEQQREKCFCCSLAQYRKKLSSTPVQLIDFTLRNALSEKQRNGKKFSIFRSGGKADQDREIFLRNNKRDAVICTCKKCNLIDTREWKTFSSMREKERVEK